MELRIHDKIFTSWIDRDEIAATVKELAVKIRADYPNQRLLLICVMKGSLVFFSDLMRSLDGEMEMAFISASSYQGTHTSGIVQVHARSELGLKGRHCLLIEDIVDTGLTIQALEELLWKEEPACLDIATLLFKPEAFKGNKRPKFIGKEIPDRFVVGYGMDYNELGRNLPDIYQLKL